MRRSPPVIGGIVVLLLALSETGSPAQTAPANRFPEQELSENDNKPDELDEARALRATQRQRLAEGMNLIKPVVFVPLVAALVVAIILYLTPSEIYKIRPFDKSRDRKASNDVPDSDNGYRDSDFNW